MNVLRIAIIAAAAAKAVLARNGEESNYCISRRSGEDGHKY